MKRGFWILLLALPFTASVSSFAEVIETSDLGFVSRHVVEVPVTRLAAYEGLVDRVAAWWDPDHTYSGDSSNLTIDDQPSGCFCEELPNQGGVEHGRVLLVKPGEALRIQSALGPLQEFSVTGILNFSFAEIDSGGTRIELTYQVGGYRPGGLAQWSTPVDGVLNGQMQRLKKYLSGL